MIFGLDNAHGMCLVSSHVESVLKFSREALMGHKDRYDPTVTLVLSWAFVLVFSVFVTVAMAESSPPAQAAVVVSGG